MHTLKAMQLEIQGYMAVHCYELIPTSFREGGMEEGVMEGVGMDKVGMEEGCMEGVAWKDGAKVTIWFKYRYQCRLHARV